MESGRIQPLRAPSVHREAKLCLQPPHWAELNPTSKAHNVTRFETRTPLPSTQKRIRLGTGFLKNPQSHHKCISACVIRNFSRLIFFWSVQCGVKHGERLGVKEGVFDHFGATKPIDLGPNASLGRVVRHCLAISAIFGASGMANLSSF